VLFVALLMLVVGYSMVYSALHGDWQFWKTLIPSQAPAVTSPAQ
jgi:hypothetical protein